MKPNIYSIFLPQQGCPNRCIFCNQQAATGVESIQSPAEIKQQIITFLTTTDSYSTTPEIAFYGGNFTGLGWADQQELLSIVKEAVYTTGIPANIRISTKPDYIDKIILARLKEDQVSTIELGIQSLSNDVLNASNRHYTAATAIKACRLVLESGLNLGVHLMLGLPKDTKEKTLKSVDKILALHPNFIRIHPTLVLRNTELEKQYSTGNYQPLSLTEAIEWCKEMVYRCDQAQVPVARLGLQPSPELCKPGTVVAGPFHSAFGELVKSAVALDTMNQELSRYLEQHREVNQYTFYVPTRELSIYRGQHNQNLARLKQVWNLDNISIETMPAD